MKSMPNSVPSVSVRTVAASMIAVAVAFGAAMAVPALSGIPTGSQATVAVYHQADWGQSNPRQRRIVIARNNRAPNEALLLVVQSNPAAPAM
ncbi:MAG: hypothetical protein K2Y71_02170 [Xanthobacteraceae bacterium]|nr:hypothetical protein [Xanthobacteraceae bacterium]